MTDHMARSRVAVPSHVRCACATIHIRLISVWDCSVIAAVDLRIAVGAGISRGRRRPQVPPNPSSGPLVLLGGTVVDVTDWGRSAKDQQDAIVIVQNGRITDVGTRAISRFPRARTSSTAPASSSFPA